MPPRSKATSLLRRLRNPTASSRSAQCSFGSPNRSFSSPSNSSPADSAYTSVSPDEVSHFNALASSWWDPQGPSRILHLMNPLRHDFICSCRSSVFDDPPPPSNGLKYLDIGCGGGIFAESAARLPTTASVTAIDPSSEVLSVAKAHAKRDPALRSKLTYINTPIEQLPAPNAPNDGYDVVSIFEVVEHVSNPAQFLDRCTPFVKPGGWLVLSTIARTWMSWLTTNLVAEDLLRIVPKGTHDWRKYINEEELRNHFLLKRTEWTEPRCMGVVYVPGLGWKEVSGSEKVGNYFFGVRRVVEST
ncbi:ubiquinone biosynthesis O-methyltransferase [Annulohypoxylon truncatum]|uniref:ubiquinone biosynthesis O-methyltransferase n=1 Tax=Annulohypoxylon truncatum TaxID=327061 RepID=UPI002007BB26|nr:ubiquinone biosynthesis O-methyltransferase [Annulohypoxylon truncatum]KAI1208542.1 ubiquinone biosynthesis O-methyltransferase [Annulohypoxylon truncatum]